jgi:UDP-2-acetamido-3-amino-2,3-dideoxy-glucuronate N-acetyltransferase
MTSKSSYFIHESSYVDEDVEIGEGTKIWHFSHIQSGARIGHDCTIGQNVNIGNNVVIGNKVKIQNNVSIYEGVELENYVFCGPSAVFTNINRPRSKFPQRGSDFYEKTLVKESATLGANCTILCGVTIGEYAFVGAGAVVTKDVAPHSLMTGNPAKRVCWVGFMGERLSFDKDGISNCKKFKQRGNKLFYQ